MTFECFSHEWPITNCAAFIANSNFFTSLAGAVAGAVTILFVERTRRRRQIIADINTSMAVLSGILNSLLNTKSLHTLPAVQSYNDNINLRNHTVANGLPHPTYKFRLRIYECSEMPFELPLERIFAIYALRPRSIQMLMQAKTAVSDVTMTYKSWNDVINQMMQLEQNEKADFYFGTRKSSGTRVDLLPSALKNIGGSVDHALFFLRYCIRDLHSTGRGLFWQPWLKNKIAKEPPVTPAFSGLMPPEDFRKDWLE